VNDADGAEIDPRTVRWPGVVGARYRIEQTLRYEYEAPIRNLRHRLIIAPRRRHFDQERLASHLWTPAAGPLSLVRDDFGNDVAAVNVPHVEREIAFSLEATIRRDARRDRGAPAGDALDDLHDPRWRDTGRLTRADDVLADAAADLRARYPNERELAHAIVRYVNGRMDYTKGVTDVFTTAAVAFAQARGVCQDFAHIAISLARSAGLPARYVSGHLIGESATHAWVEFLVRERGGAPVAVSLDPTYRSATDFRYVVVAVGRDYDDVPTTSGVFTGKSSGVLHARQHVGLLDVTYAA
jgi:transglutaminase-like putative cysteine protease